ncbi:MAG: biotin--[acetyl-CoA-carboxylase] ligase [Planctomycetota bacterium]|nr:biotin--[acetyl-CoA-carboxylase] ligase [Planctomycetota bacterium]
MNADRIRDGIKVSSVGNHILCVDHCSSTNDLAWKESDAGAPHGTVIFAESQASGRGRRGRSWVSLPGSSLLCSVLLRPRIPLQRLPLVTALGALAITDLAQRYGIEARVRFPNDVYVGRNKLAGILAESRFSSSESGAIVVGIGVNVTGFPSDLPSTSLSAECGKVVDREEAARHLIESVDQWVSHLDGPVEPFQKAWQSRSDLIGNRVVIRQEGEVFPGTVLDVHCLEGVRLQLEGGGEKLFRGEFIEKLDLL